MIGAGNVATHLTMALHKAGHSIKQVYSRTEKSAKELAKKVDSKATSSVDRINETADLYIVSIKDKVIPQAAKSLNIENKNIVHTAGSVPLSVFQEAKNHGVFYPLQTFSKEREVNFKEIPICIEANNEEFGRQLTGLANQISESVWQIDSVQRKLLHLSAVFACNFVNHMYVIAKQLIGKKDIDYKILYPLIKETANKATMMDPKLAQTGPAARNDTESMEKHIELLSSCPEIKEIYKIISKSISLI